MKYNEMNAGRKPLVFDAYSDMLQVTFKFNRDAITFNCHGIQTVSTVAELQNGTLGISYRQVIVSGKVLESLHQTSLHITSFGRLDSSIDQTFTTRNSVEKKFGRSQTRKETVADETLCRWALG